MRSLTPDALMERITAGDPPVILDVRSKHEFDAGHVPGAVHVPFWQAGRHSQTLAATRESPIVLYCGHGPRAHIAGAALKRRGFTNILYLAGHMKKWRAMKLPLAIVCFLIGAGALVAQQPDVRMVGVEGEGAKYWPVWRGPSGQGLATGHVPGHVVGDGERRVEEAGAGPWQLVADRVGRQDFSDERLRRRPPRVAHRVPAIRRRPTVGGVCAGRQSGARALQERPRIGHAVDRRDARLRVVRQPRPGGVRLQRQARLAQGSRRRRQLPRLSGIAAAVQEPHHPVSGF